MKPASSFSESCTAWIITLSAMFICVSVVHADPASLPFTGDDLSTVTLEANPFPSIGNTAIAYPAVIGPIEKVDLAENQIVVSGVSIDTSELAIDDYSIGEYVWIGGEVSKQSVSTPTIFRLQGQYVFGASISYVEGFVSRVDANNARVFIGTTEIEFSSALSRSSTLSLSVDSYIRAVGIQVQPGKVIAADLSVASQARTTTTNNKKLATANNRDAKAIIGGDRSAKAIIGGDRSTKAIIGGDRSTKAIIGGDRSAKAIIGGDRSL